MELNIERSGTAATVVVSGDLDADHAYDAYIAAVTEAEAGANTVVVDVSGVGFIDSTGLGMLVRTRDDLINLYESKLVLRNPSPNVGRLLDLTALRAEFDVSS